MKKILKLFLYIFVFIVFFIIFLPKESFYNLLEKELEKNQIIISNEIKKEKPFSFSVMNADIFYQGSNISKVDDITFNTYLVQTKVTIKNINFLDSLSSFAPTPINEVIFEHSIFDFNKINIKSKGTFGELSGYIDILKREVKIELSASNMMKNSYNKLLQNMKLTNERYIYEYKF
ncbi:hypothetical protein AVENP_2499 [Arcobacter venerupis]|uniref:Uncharacterized protein n=1 Tax=Arcobacter venerupis TaxID=1054033 RepID=A0AAE7E473_9BACT|nr:hypothetical protein [Arcobacter venerupis]QKF68003.1 hypothetical protein AVENP_2499 [Arcobacter venerupis]RWS48285.1 hypothetical protein CKA56_14580 [Arcobacter venerupis]